MEGNEISCVPNDKYAHSVFLSLGPNITQVTINDLAEGTNYTFTAHSKLGDQISQASKMHFKTKLRPVTKAKASSIEPTKVTVTWEDEPLSSSSSNNGYGRQNLKSLAPKPKTTYRVICSCNKGGVEYTTKQKKFTINNLAPGSDYNVKVFKTDRDLTSWSDPVSIHFRTPLNPPKNFRVVSKSRQKIALEWVRGRFSNTHGRPYYTIKLKLIDERYNRHRIQMVEDLVRNSIRYTFSKLRPNTLYQIELMARSKDVEGIDSKAAVVNVRTNR